MKKLLPDQNVLLSLFTYLDGKLYYKKSRYKNKIGKEITNKSTDGYFRVTYNKKTYQLHNIIWKMLIGTEPDQIDHINHDRTDNRIENLRNTSQKENTKNRSIMKNNTSGYSNIRILKSKIKNYGVYFSSENYSKYFLTLEEAIQHRDEKYIEFGYHKNHGSTFS